MFPIRVTTRCRVDLAGGTLDIWPIGLLHPGATTVNVAVDLPVRVELRPRSTGWCVTQGESRVETDVFSELAGHPDTALVALVLERGGSPPCELSITSGSPRGAGLGASSALTVALLASVEWLLTGATTATVEQRAAVARDLEARLMQLPTGRQDHFPAQLGGALVIEHAPGGERVRHLEVDLEGLGDRMLVGYTGQSHFSAGNNWQVIRRRLECDPAVVERLDAVRDAARGVVRALEAADWPAVGAGMAADWRARRGLAPEIPTPAIERLLESAERRGAWGGKACGAGGGGCVAVLLPPERRAEVAAAWVAAGAQVLAARPTALGLELGVDAR